MIEQSLQEQIELLFAEYDQPDTPGCALGIVQNGKLIYQKGYGLANLEYGVPLTSQSVFSIASVSKQFTAMCIALLEEAGKLDIEDDIRKYLPELPEYPEQIRIKHLVHMTSGLRSLYLIENYLKGLPEDGILTDEQAFSNVLQIKKSFFTPGERYSYGNTDYFLLAQIIKRVSGKSFARYAEEQIFAPLGMKNSFVREDHTQIIRNRAQGYWKYTYSHYTDKLRTKYRHTQDQYAIAMDNTESPGAGQVWSTVEDLALWINNFFDNKLGRGTSELIEKVTRPGRLNNGRECGYGYGLFLSERKQRKVIFHEGGGVGENAVIYMIPEEKLAIICLANTNDFLMKIYRKLGKVEPTELISDYILEGLPDSAPFEADVPGNCTDQGLTVEPGQESVVTKALSTEQRTELLRFVGGYQNPATSSIWELSLEEDRLIAQINHVSQVQLLPLGNGLFTVSDTELTCQFTYDEQGQVTRLVIKDGDSSATFLPFISITDEKLMEYVGEYRCEELNTSYYVKSTKGQLYLYNKDRTRYALDLYYQPTIEDHFSTYTPPYVPDNFTITFLRGEDEQITGFVYRDYDGDGREMHQFLRKG